MIARRSFLSGLASLIAAPAIVHAGNLMPVRAVKWAAPKANTIELTAVRGHFAIGDMITIHGMPEQYVVRQIFTGGRIALALDFPA